MSEKKDLDLIQIVEQFTDFIRTKAEDDEDIRENVLPIVEQLSTGLEESIRFEKDYPAVSKLLSFLVSQMEDHDKKLNILKDCLLEMREEQVNPHGLTKEELAAYASYKKTDKDMLN